MIQIRISANAASVLNRHRKLMEHFSNVQKSGTATPFLAKRKSDYRILAQTIVLNQVYMAYTPKKYRRTWQLFQAVDISQANNDSFAVEISLSESLKMVRPNSRHSYYPALVPLGITSIYPVESYPPRDWYYNSDGWLEQFGAKFASDYYNTVVRENLR